MKSLWLAIALVFCASLAYAGSVDKKDYVQIDKDGVVTIVAFSMSKKHYVKTEDGRTKIDSDLLATPAPVDKKPVMAEWRMPPHLVIHKEEPAPKDLQK